MASIVGNPFNKIMTIFVLYIKHLLKQLLPYTGCGCDVFGRAYQQLGEGSLPGRKRGRKLGVKKTPPGTPHGDAPKVWAVNPEFVDNQTRTPKPASLACPVTGP